MSRTHKKTLPQPSSKEERLSELELELVRERADDRAWHHSVLDRLHIRRTGTEIQVRIPLRP